MLFAKAHKLVRLQINDVLSQFDISPSQWSILSVVAGSPDGIRLASVAKALGVKAPLVTLEVNELLRLELVQRLPHHSDKRAKILVATSKGKQLASKLEKLLSQRVSQHLQGLTESEIATFQKALQTIIDNS